MFRRSPALLVGALLALTTACNNLVGSSKGTPVAVVNLNARTKGAGYTTSPVASFYSATSISLASASAASDSCVQAPYAADATTATTATIIGGGAYVLTQVSGNSDSLKQSSSLGDGSYRLSSASGLAFTPGDSITFSIPGDVNGFPRTVITGRTAEAFVLDTSNVSPPVGQTITLHWTAPLDANAAMIASFRYSDGTVSGLNQQLFCDFHDTGTLTVPASLAALYLASGSHQLFVERVRTTVFQVAGSGAWFNMLSVFERPTPVSP